MFRTIYRVVTVCCIICCVGCSEQHVQGSGQSKTERRSVSVFHQIDVNGSFIVDVVAGKQQSVRVQADDNVLALVETQVKHGDLYIHPTSHAHYSAKNPVRVIITMKRLDAIHSAGSNEFMVKGINQDHLLVQLDGAGKVQLAGKVQALDITANGTGIIAAKDLVVQSARVKLSGAGEAIVHAVDALTVDVSGVATVKYIEKPRQMQVLINGVGKVEQYTPPAQPPAIKKRSSPTATDKASV